jgi:IS30 family transposase
MRRLGAPEARNLWRRWLGGQTLAQISAALEVPPGTIYERVRKRGGVAPQPRFRSRRHLTLDDRETISRAIAQGISIRAVASTLGRSPSTISREIQRNGGRQAYRACRADDEAWKRARRPKRCKLAALPELRDIVAAKLEADWSPMQVSCWLRKEFRADDGMHVSHETIYRTLFIQARGVLRKELKAHLRSRRSLRRPKKRTQRKPPPAGIVDPVSIRERPAEANDRAVPGHWEGDLLMGKDGKSQIATLVERASRFTLLVRVENKETETVVPALTECVKQLPESLKRSLTWDRGPELANHEEFFVATDVQVYFCDPRSPWQRGSNENTNGLLRQYFPKGMDLSDVTQERLDEVALRLNTRPRMTLEWDTPGEKLLKLLQ